MDAATVTSITTAVNWATIVTGLGAIFAAAAGFYIAFKGGKFLIGAIKGA
jgi:hypothetical protein